MGAKKTQYKVPLDWHIVDLADGRTAGPGDFVELTEEQVKDPHNVSLIEEGRLLKLEEKTTQQKKEG